MSSFSSSSYGTGTSVQILYFRDHFRQRGILHIVWLTVCLLGYSHSVVVEGAVASADKIYCVGSSAVVSPHCISTVPAQAKGLAEPTHSELVKEKLLGCLIFFFGSKNILNFQGPAQLLRAEMLLRFCTWLITSHY